MAIFQQIELLPVKANVYAMPFFFLSVRWFSLPLLEPLKLLDSVLTRQMADLDMDELRQLHLEKINESHHEPLE
ncbi:hypothetical protein J6590_072107 [Homalodisca vitripennis]|nr:hypothetical protein J6590_072107 [Homalodisca vitripennis]